MLGNDEMGWSTSLSLRKEYKLLMLTDNKWRQLLKIATTVIIDTYPYNFKLYVGILLDQHIAYGSIDACPNTSLHLRKHFLAIFLNEVIQMRTETFTLKRVTYVLLRFSCAIRN